LRPIPPRPAQEEREPRFSVDTLPFQGFRFDRVFAQESRGNSLEAQPRLKSFENFPNFKNLQNNVKPEPIRKNRININRARATVAPLKVSQIPSFTQITSLATEPTTTLTTKPPRPPPNADPRKRINSVSNVQKEATFDSSNGDAREIIDKFKSLKEEVKSSLAESMVDQSKPQNIKRQRKQKKTEPVATEENDNLSTLNLQVRNIELKLNAALQESKKKQRTLVKCQNSNKEFKAEVEELENRTRLHIEYAQEKQIEIELLEKGYEVFKNQSVSDKLTISTLNDEISDLKNQIEMKDLNITDLVTEMTLLDNSFKKEMERNHREIKSLTQKFSSTVISLETNKQLLIAEEAKNKKVVGDLEKAKEKIRKLRKEKKNLLKIVQQLAEIGNPALNFMSEFIIDEDEDSNKDLAHKESESNLEENIEEEFLEDIASLEVEGSGDGI